MHRSDSDWRAVLLHALLWLLGSLPLRALQALGALVGRWAGWRGTREARVSRRNLEVCWPGLDDAAREALWRATLRESGRTFAETARFWSRPAARTLPLVREVQGGALLDAALAAGRGVIVAAPHLGNWELLNQWLAARMPLAIVYRPPERGWVDALLRRARQHPGITQVRAEGSGVRTLFRILKDGGNVGILPDQQPKQGEGEFAPFFGIDALTMTLLPRLAQRSGATVLFAFAERLPEAAGFRIRILPAPPGIDDPDPRRAATALNAGVEACVRLCPAQYQWTYTRFSWRRGDVDPQWFYRTDTRAEVLDTAARERAAHAARSDLPA